MHRWVTSAHLSRSTMTNSSRLPIRAPLVTTGMPTSSLRLKLVREGAFSVPAVAVIGSTSCSTLQGLHKLVNHQAHQHEQTSPQYQQPTLHEPRHPNRCLRGPTVHAIDLL